MFPFPIEKNFPANYSLIIFQINILEIVSPVAKYVDGNIQCYETRNLSYGSFEAKFVFSSRFLNFHLWILNFSESTICDTVITLLIWKYANECYNFRLKSRKNFSKSDGKSGLYPTKVRLNMCNVISRSFPLSDDALWKLKREAFLSNCNRRPELTLENSLKARSNGLRLGEGKIFPKDVVTNI